MIGPVGGSCLKMIFGGMEPSRTDGIMMTSPYRQDTEPIVEDPLLGWASLSRNLHSGFQRSPYLDPWSRNLHSGFLGLLPCLLLLLLRTRIIEWGARLTV